MIKCLDKNWYDKNLPVQQYVNVRVDYLYRMLRVYESEIGFDFMWFQIESPFRNVYKKFLSGRIASVQTEINALIMYVYSSVNFDTMSFIVAACADNS